MGQLHGGVRAAAVAGRGSSIHRGARSDEVSISALHSTSAVAAGSGIALTDDTRSVASNTTRAMSLRGIYARAPCYISLNHLRCVAVSPRATENPKPESTFIRFIYSCIVF